MNKPDLIRVRDVMRANFCLVDGLMTVDQALRRLKDQDARVLVIQKRDEDDEYGLVDLPDIARKVLTQNRSPERVNVYEIMRKPALNVRPEMQVKYCARLLDRFNLRAALVIDNAGDVAGIVSYDDLVMGGLVDFSNESTEAP